MHPLRISSLCPSPHSCVPGCFSVPPASSSSLTRLRIFNGMMEVSNPEALNYYTLSCLILWIQSEARNPTVTHLPLSGSLNSPLCDLIALTPGLAFFLPMTRTLAAASSFSSGKAYPSISFLSPLSSLDPYSDYAEVNISLNSSSSLSFLNIYAHLFALLRRIAELTPFPLHFSLLQKSLHSGGLYLSSPPLRFKRYF